jgi:uncharacterized protein
MKSLNWLDWTVLVLVLIGAINWGLVGLFKFDLVSAILGDLSILSRIVYVLVGIAAVYFAMVSVSLKKQE